MYRDRIRVIPVVIALAMGIFIGIVTYVNGHENRDIYFRTAVAIAMFYPVGIMVKKTIEALNEKSGEQADTEEEKGKNIDIAVGEENEEFTPLAEDLKE